MATNLKINAAKEPKKFRTRSVRFRLTAYFIVFALALMGMLWAFQTLFLEQYYESEMEKKVQAAVSTLSIQYSASETLDLEGYLQEIGRLSNANDMYFFIEAEDESFNTWVESETPVPGEHLIDYYQYKYAVNIGFNLEDVVYSRGCAIFLHCKSNDHWYTAGCVSLSEEDMVTLLLMLRDGAYMIIVPDAESIGDY